MKAKVNPSIEDYVDYYSEIADSMKYLMDIGSVDDKDMEESLKVLWYEALEKKEEYEDKLNEEWKKENMGQVIAFERSRL